MFKRTIFGVTLAPVFAACVALTAYAVTGGHAAGSAIHEHALKPCDDVAVTRVEQRDAARLYDVSAVGPPQLTAHPAQTVSCAKASQRS